MTPAPSLANFIIGPGNTKACAAARLAAIGAPVGCRTLVIQGGTGLGKTHLLASIECYILERRAGTPVARLAAEKFAVEYLQAEREGGLPAFRERYRPMLSRVRREAETSQ